jgi:hypothetical protein
MSLGEQTIAEIGPVRSMPAGRQQMIIAETSRLNHAQHKSVLKSLKAHIASRKATLAAMEAGVAQLVEECEILRRCRPS